jgi:hypothetical protein
MTASTTAAALKRTTFRLTGSAQPASDPESDTLVQRAIHRRAPTPVGIVVTADNHLAAALPQLTPERRSARRERLRCGLSAAVDYAIKNGARLFVTAGDLFDSPAPNNQERAFVAAELVRLRRANILCVGIGGLADGSRTPAERGGDAPLRTYAALEGLTYFPATRALTPRLVGFGKLRLAVAGLSADPTAAPGSDPLAGLGLADPDGVLARADLGLLVVHASIAGMASMAGVPGAGVGEPGQDRGWADEAARSPSSPLSSVSSSLPTVTHASLSALPDLFRVVVAGGVHRFARATLDGREVVVPGATERMDFATPAGSSGFAWLEITSDGLTAVRHIAVPEQPRADVEVATARLFPSGIPAPEAPDGLAEDLDVLPALTPSMDGTERAHGENGENGENGDEQDLWELRGLTRPASAAEPDQVAAGALATVRAALDPVCTDETLVRLRLAGPITREQYHHLPLRDILRYGQRQAFAFELDTRGLVLIEPVSPASASVQRGVRMGALAPAVEVERLVAERLASLAPDDAEGAADLRAAAALLLARLRVSSDREADL